MDPHLLAALGALFQVVLIDVALAGDNAVVVGLAVAGLSPHQKTRAMLFGIVAATVIRAALAAVAIRLLAVVGLTLAGGLLLAWVCWRMYRELRHAPAAAAEGRRHKTMAQAVTQIAIADLSMSLDNVLAVAGAARAHPWAMYAGLALSIAMMGAAAGLLSRLLARYRWIAWLGLAVVVFVAGRMIVDGFADVLPLLGRMGLTRYGV